MMMMVGSVKTEGRDVSNGAATSSDDNETNDSTLLRVDEHLISVLDAAKEAVDELKGVSTEEYSPSAEKLDSIGARFLDNCKSIHTAISGNVEYLQSHVDVEQNGFSENSVKYAQAEKLALAREMLKSIHEEVYSVQQQRG